MESPLNKITTLQKELFELIENEKVNLMERTKQIQFKRENFQRDFTNIIELEKLKLAEKEQALRTEKSKWEAQLLKVEPNSIPSKIKLDIGGKIFITSKSTLQAPTNKFFVELFSGKYTIDFDEDGCFFIDRDPSVFNYILTFLRGNPIKIERLSTYERFLLVEDAKFYQIPGILDLLGETTKQFQFNWKAGVNCSVSADGNSVTSVTGNWLGTAIGDTTLPKIGIHEFEIKLTKTTSSHVIIGVVPPSVMSNLNAVTELDFLNSEAYYFYCYNSTLYSKYGGKQKAYSMKVQQGGRVKLIIDYKDLTVGFEINGQNFDVTQAFPSGVDLIPFVLFGEQGDVITKL